MKKMLFVATWYGTVKSFLIPFARYFGEKGWHVDAMAEGISGCSACKGAFSQVWEVEWTRNPLDLKNILRAPRTVREVVEREGYELVHVHTPVAAFVTRFALRTLPNGRKPKVVYTAHGFHFHKGGRLWKNLLFLALEKLAGRWTDYLVVINEEDLEATGRYGIVPPSRGRYMPGIGVDFKDYDPALVSKEDVARLRKELGLAEGARLFSMVANFDPGKRHRDVLHAMVGLRQEDVHIAFAGRGVLLEQMTRLATELEIGEQVHFLGYRQDIPVLLRASAAMILPSEREGLPRSIMEALCLEVPCIGSNIRGIRDLLGQGAGMLVEVGDTRGLMAAMEWVLHNPLEAHQMACVGRKQMAHYEVGHILRLQEELYCEALQA